MKTWRVDDLEMRNFAAADGMHTSFAAEFGSVLRMRIREDQAEQLRAHCVVRELSSALHVGPN